MRHNDGVGQERRKRLEGRAKRKEALVVPLGAHKLECAGQAQRLDGAGRGALAGLRQAAGHDERGQARNCSGCEVARVERSGVLWGGGGVV